MAYTFSQLPPGKLLIQLLQKKFTGHLVLSPPRAKVIIGFHEGRAVTMDVEGTAPFGSTLDEALLWLFTPDAPSFSMAGAQVSPGKGVNPLSVIKEGVLRHYTKDRLFNEAKDLLRGKLTFVDGYEPYIPHFEFTPEQSKVIIALATSPASARELAEKTGTDLLRVIGLLYVLAMARLITLSNLKSASHATVSEDELSAEGRALLEDLKKEAEAMGNEDLFVRFGLNRDASTESVEKMFREKARKFHPDVVARKGLAAYRELASAYFEKLTETYNILKDPVEREKLKTEPISKEDQESVRKILEAEMAYQKALIHFRRREYEEAEEHMKTAVKNSPDDGSYLGLWAWITYINPANNKDAIRDSIKKALIEAVELTKREPNLHYYLGKILSDAGQKASAIQHLKRCLALNPEHIEASRELRMISRESTRDNSLLSKTGAFLSIFKKK